MKTFVVMFLLILGGTACSYAKDDLTKMPGKTEALYYSAFWKNWRKESVYAFTDQDRNLILSVGSGHANTQGYIPGDDIPVFTAFLRQSQQHLKTMASNAGKRRYRVATFKNETGQGSSLVVLDIVPANGNEKGFLQLTMSDRKTPRETITVYLKAADVGELITLISDI